MFLLSFLTRRTKKYAIDHRLPLLQGRFGIVIPMDAMGFSNRWSYGFAFGAISYSVLELFRERHIPKVFPDWAKAVAYLIGAFEVGLAYFPFFACLSTPYKATGAKWWNYQKPIYQWPWILSLIFLLGRFVSLLVKAVCKQCKAEQEELMHTHQTEHVKRLLRKTAANSNSLNWFQRRVYEWDPHFKFPNRLIGTAIISLLTLYMVPRYKYQSINQSISDTFSTKTGLNMVVYVCHVLVCYRKQIKRLWKGHKDFLPKKLQNPSSAASVASIAKYSGWQIAFSLWGKAVCFITHSFLTCFNALIHIDILVFLMLSRVTFGLLFALLKLQVLLVKYFFLQDKISPTDDKKPLALNNRNAFNCFNYFFFFYNVVMGITSCFLRMMISFMLGTWLVSRIDRTIMQKGYEKLDRGFCTWIGMIFADHYHSNPVMVCFCQLLISHVQDVQHDSSYSILNNAPCGKSHGRAKKRWRLFYTLLKNPHLIPLRKHHLRANVPLKLSSSPQADIVVRAWLMRSQAATELVSDNY
uniref:Uncharacterized protein n=1 Tax=Periophthalmus magnuspinnatus TaxID=409849 RepID=A0A3B3ZE08_9GOBI